MKMTELLRAVNSVAQTGASDEQIQMLAREADNLADMVGWADGPIDPTGQWLGRLASLQEDLQHRYAQTNDTALVALNDRLTRLGQAIAQHDGDLEAGEGEDEDFT